MNGRKKVFPFSRENCLSPLIACIIEHISHKQVCKKGTHKSKREPGKMNTVEPLEGGGGGGVDDLENCDLENDEVEIENVVELKAKFIVV